ncbi:RNA recognition motif domain-containing protein [Phthorimaea operculella]|nr:RNA recognition motif domain-containing protein [Phthorimaea operculella]
MRREVTEDVIHTISTPHGQVQRIVVFKKNGVQAMVEFESVDSATRAKEALHGCDIYSGCCTLKIEFAKVCIDGAVSFLKRGNDLFTELHKLASIIIVNKYEGGPARLRHLLRLLYAQN